MRAEQNLYELLANYKCRLPKSLPFCLQIYDENKNSVGELRCIDVYSADDVEIAGLLTRWREKYMRYFMTQFDATIERTLVWLKKVVLPAKDRMLFIILDDKGRAIGNIGVCNISEEYAEIDNLIRGESGGLPQLIYFAEIALLSWLFNELRIPKVGLHVFSNNVLTINLHRMVGFSLVHSHRCTKITEGNETRFLLDSVQGEPVTFRYNEMSLGRDEFLRLHNLHNRHTFTDAHLAGN